MNYHKIEKASIANGTGIRVVLWCSGCRVMCRNCQNPQTWDFNSGQPFDESAKQELFKALDKPYIQGCTFSGGHPLEPENVYDVYVLIKEIKEKFPTKDIWLYTGYTLNYDNFTILIKGVDPKSSHWNWMNEVLCLCDIVIDGPYIEEQRDLTLKFCGSRNQRLIDVQKTLAQGEITLWNG